MKIQKTIFAHNRQFYSLSDHSSDALKDPQCLFVKTTLNERFHQDVSHIQSIKEDQLKDYFSLPKHIIGITGTNGKTTTAALIAHTLKQNHHKVALLGTRGFFINGVQKRPKGLTTPTVLELYTLLEEAKECDFFVMEVSSHAIVQNRIASLQFACKILTNITSDHLDFHKTHEEYIRVKNSFFDHSCPEVINADEKNAHIQKAITYGLHCPADFKATNIISFPFISAQIHSPSHQAHLKLQMCGLHNLYNALACISSLVQTTPLSLQEICMSLANFQGVEGRMEIVSSSPLIVVDFAHTHDGMEKILENFQNQKIVVVFGAGGDRDKEKRPKMGAIAEKYASKIYLTSDNPRSENPECIIQEIASGIQNHQKIISFNPDRFASIQHAITHLQDDEILFVLGKGDEPYQIIQDQYIPFDDREVIRSVLKSLNISQ
ncbi:UDP-N-acetylmuramoyl-L-alanyl-D-glutamate--2,6-diaminopimelate ligase [Helicobacter kayseriensis]|uniref:UDP-N-acetylmuramoyl-L-alanyl-D-glutamate--2, 6-diaminopimelate ligase n=1 Tax=Helicobacter kayseriensis TaxID=2905877 RepID=UPI001E463BCF|nr:UDP-N-acetylmuramoyl-L-alanyl-D-glutamate--2,6-diaminopimelate ligase [Helicobacter kayseriensis]MCE3046484.1 UDP-N-acetylmuramoyl-L-alanyl-D-glutamate--2,6-diaminopimelate ligase [Helicobacter kayseriensis]MCE3048213.1 UDP-N-acetylmuramoyl-L-alanyl-D-glutamate--2,6-diaminopimelate ligase [Helicobacter kayseriensis]